MSDQDDAAFLRGFAQLIKGEFHTANGERLEAIADRLSALVTEPLYHTEQLDSGAVVLRSGLPASRPNQATKGDGL